MIQGLAAALTWALDTVILGLALSNPVFFSTPLAIALATFVSTFLHDACSAVFSFLYMGIRGKLTKTWRTLCSRQGLVIVGAALIGAPVGMTGYVMAINNIGAAYTAAISAFFPAWGALLAAIFLKEKMRAYQWVGLLVCAAGVAALGYEPVEGVPGDWVTGVMGALLCVFGWGTEAVIIDWGLRNAAVDDECAMQIRQTTSALTYALVIIPLLGGWACVAETLSSTAMPIIALAALMGTASYLFYYKAISRIGASRAMALNITYSAWSIPFSLLLLGTIPDLRGIVCALIIIAGAILAAADMRELLGESRK